MTTLYHASETQINEFKNDRPIWFTTEKKDVQEWSGFIYSINVDLSGIITTDDYMDFHTGEILNKTNSTMAKMNSEGQDNNWYVFLNVKKYNPIEINQKILYF